MVVHVLFVGIDVKRMAKSSVVATVYAAVRGDYGQESAYMKAS